MSSIRHPILLVATLVGAACTATSEEVAPPQYDPYFPADVQVSDDEQFLFVLSANSDLRYDSGTIQAYDLQAIDDMLEGWVTAATVPPACAPDPLDSRLLDCPGASEDGTLAPFVIEGGAVKVGSFGSAIGQQRLVDAQGDPSDIVRLFATIRGDPSLTWVDFDTRSRTMSCGGEGSFPRCDDAHRLVHFLDDPDLDVVLGAEPFDLAVDGPNENVFVTHLTTGVVSLAFAPRTVGSAPVLVDRLAGLFAQSQTTGFTRAAGVAVRQEGSDLGLAYVTSSTEARIATVSAARGPVNDEGVRIDRLAPGPSFLFSRTLTPGHPGDARGITFTPDGDRAFVVNRTPPELLVFDTSLTASGAPRNELLGQLTLCEQPVQVAVADFGAGLRAYVPCFASGRVGVTRPELRTLEAVISVGAGPIGVAAAPGRKRVYVTNFAEDTIAVIDAKPGSPTQNRAVLELGRERSREDRQ